jgi:hypothetical protein
MSKRTIAVMGRLLDQEDGLGVYGVQLLRELLRLDPHSRYVILLDSPKSQHLFREFGNAETRVLPALSKLYWDQVVAPLAARRCNADLIFNPKFSIPLFTRRPCVFVQQGSDWYVNPQNYPWWDNLYIRLMLPLYSLKAARTLRDSSSQSRAHCMSATSTCRPTPEATTSAWCADICAIAAPAARCRWW